MLITKQKLIVGIQIKITIVVHQSYYLAMKLRVLSILKLKQAAVLNMVAFT